MVETGGSGAGAYVKITKTRECFDAKTKELTVYQTDLVTLRSLLPTVAAHGVDDEGVALPAPD